jgi:hypothetical protein
MTRKARKRLPEAEVDVEKYPNLLKELGIKVVSQGEAVIEEVTRRRWRLTTPNGMVTEHTTEKKAKKAADNWLDAQLEHTTKTIGVMGIDTRRKARHPIPGSAPRRRASRLMMIPMGIRTRRRQSLRPARAGHTRKR